ncbi:unnamed protein product, partial [marine sediment metagenome]
MGVVVACSLPLILCWYVLQGIRAGSDDEAALNQFLLCELTAE